MAARTPTVQTLEFISVWARAWADTRLTIHSGWFWLTELVVGAIVGTFSGSPAWGVLAVVIAFLVVFVWHSLRAPVKQRNECMERLNEIASSVQLELLSVSPHFVVGSFLMDVRFMLKLHNRSHDVALKYTVTSFNVSTNVGGKLVDDLLNHGGIILPQRSTEFGSPLLQGIPDSDSLEVSIDFNIIFNSEPPLGGDRNLSSKIKIYADRAGGTSRMVYES